jgi:tetratricopeptide (TPR) repeat protein
MRRKIEWYQEVLALEPGSRIFFPLAKLFVEFGQLEDAEKTLRQGLDRHPDSMEARLLLIQVLMRLERLEDAQEQLQAVIKPLERYPAFWSLWAHQTSDKDRDFAVFLMLVASHFTDRPVKWTDVVIEGLSSLTDRLIGPLKATARKARELSLERSAAPVAADPAPTCDAQDSPYAGPAPDAGSFRTRTMAELLASQGDFGGALGIYRELWGRALDEREKADLSSRIKTLEANLASAPSVEAGPHVAPGEDPFGKHAKNRLMSTLEALAARLESRIQA